MPERLRFAFEAGSDGTLRPYLWLSLVGPSGMRIRVRGLVDSGADLSVMPEDVLPIFGIEPASLRIEEANHNGAPIEVKRLAQPLRAALPGVDALEFELAPLVVDGIEVPLWGRDLLEHFSLSVSVSGREFSLTIA